MLFLLAFVMKNNASSTCVHLGRRTCVGETVVCGELPALMPTSLMRLLLLAAAACSDHDMPSVISLLVYQGQHCNVCFLGLFLTMRLVVSAPGTPSASCCADTGGLPYQQPYNAVVLHTQHPPFTCNKPAAMRAPQEGMHAAVNWLCAGQDPAETA